MPKRASNDPNLFAKSIVDHLINKYDPEAGSVGIADDSPVSDTRKKNPAAVALGKLGGSKGGKARAASLSPAKRKKIARKAAKARWHK